MKKLINLTLLICSFYLLPVNANEYGVPNDYLVSADKAVRMFNKEMSRCFSGYKGSNCGPWAVEQYKALKKIGEDITIDPRLRLCILQRIGELASRRPSDIDEFYDVIDGEFELHCPIDYGYLDKKIAPDDRIFDMIRLRKLPLGSVLTQCSCHEKSDIEKRRGIQEPYCETGMARLTSCRIRSQCSATTEAKANYRCY